MNTIEILLATTLYNTLRDDTFHPLYYQKIIATDNTIEKIVLLVQFLEIYTHIRKQLTYDNIEIILTNVLVMIHSKKPSTQEREAIKLCTFLLKQDFLSINLHARRQKIFHHS
jgi:hypothetical protein